MSLAIADPEIDRLVRELATLAAETPEEALRRAVEERLARLRAEAAEAEKRRRLIEDGLAIARRCAALPDRFEGDVDEFLYDENGLPR